MSHSLSSFLLPSAILLVNLFTSLFYLTILKNKRRMKAFFELPVVVQKSFVVLFVGPLFVSPFLPQPSLSMSPLFTVPVGTVLVLEGICMILFSFLRIGMIPSLREATGLATSGVYAIVRHPIYSGTLGVFLGLSLLLGALASLLYFPVSAFLYFFMTVYEERGLLEAYPEEYPAYRRKVRARIVPFVL